MSRNFKVTIEKKGCTQNFDFLSLKVCHQVSFWGAPTHPAIIEFSTLLLQLKNRRSVNKLCMAFLLFLF